MRSLVAACTSSDDVVLLLLLGQLRVVGKWCLEW
jgi:hypothetical protein